MGSGCCRCLQTGKGQITEPRRVTVKSEKLLILDARSVGEEYTQREETKEALCRKFQHIQEEANQSGQELSEKDPSDDIFYKVSEVVKRRTHSEVQKLRKDARNLKTHKSCQILNGQRLSGLSTTRKGTKRVQAYIEQQPQAKSSPVSRNSISKVGLHGGNKSMSVKVEPVQAMMKSPECPNFVGKSNANSILHSVDFNFNEIKHPESGRSSLFDSKATHHHIDKDKSFLEKVHEGFSYPVSSLASFLGAPAMPALKKQRKMEKTASWNQITPLRESEQQFYSVGNRKTEGKKKEEKERSRIRVEKMPDKEEGKKEEESDQSDAEDQQLKNVKLKNTGAEELKEEDLDSLDDEDDELSQYWDKREIVSVLSYNQNLGSYIQDLSSQKYSKSQPHYSPDEEQRSGDLKKKKLVNPKKKKLQGYKMPAQKQKRRSNSVTLENRKDDRVHREASLLLESPDTPQQLSDGSSDSVPFVIPQESREGYRSNNNNATEMEMGIHFDVPTISKEEQVQVASADYKKKFQRLIAQGGYVNGVYYPQWNDEEYALEQEKKKRLKTELLASYPYPSCLYIPKVKRAQGVTQQAFSVYQEEFQKLLLKSESLCINEYSESEKERGVGFAFNPYSIHEGALATNPVVTALSCISNYEKLFHKRLMEESIQPLTCDHPQSKLQLEKLFRVKLLINGAARSVVVSNEVPVASGGQKKAPVPLCAMASKECIGPALIEKAMLEFYETNKPGLNESGYQTLKEITHSRDGITCFHQLQNETPGLEISRLVGWVPQILSLESVDNESGIWLRLKQNFLEGNTLLAMLSNKAEDDEGGAVKLNLEHSSVHSGLVSPQPPSEFSFQGEMASSTNPEHKVLLENMIKKPLVSISSQLLVEHWYSVLDTQQPHQHLRLLRLKSSIGGMAPLPKMRYFVSNQDNLPDELEQKIRLDSVSSDGIFWIEWKEALKYFQTVSLSWNPSIYKYQCEIHSEWRNFKRADYDRFLDQTYSLEFNPQLLITIPPHEDDFEVRVFFQRHIRSYGSLTSQERNRTGLNSTLSVALQSARINMGEVKNDSGLFKNNPVTFSQEGNSTMPLALALRNEEPRKAQHIGFRLFSYEGHRIVYPHDSLRSYSCSEREITSDVFIFQNSPCEETYVLAIMKGDNFPEDENYTAFSVQFLSFVPLSVTELVRRETKQKMVIEDFWNLQKPGGSILSSQFVYNPQFTLSVSEPCILQIKAQAHKSCSLMVMLMESGKDITETPFENIVKNKNPGFYFSGFTYMEALLQAKEYTLVLATQESKQLGDYKIEISRIAHQTLSTYQSTSSRGPRKDFAINPLVLGELQHSYVKHGFWTKQNSKGTYRIMTPHFQSFLQNPGYRIELNGDTEIRARVRALDLGEIKTDFPSLSIAVYEIEDDYSFRMVLEDEGYAGRAWGHFTPPGVRLKKNKNGYLLLCINFERGATNRFELELQTSEELLNLEEFKNPFLKQNTKRVLGKWNTLNAGGCSSEPTFYRNPQYEFMALQDGEIYLELTSLDLYAVGIAIFQSGGKPILECDATQISKVSSNSTFLVELNTLRSTVVKGEKYTVVVSTYKPKQVRRTDNQTGFFDFVLSMDCEYDVKEIEVKHFPHSEQFVGDWDRHTNFGSEKYITTFLKNPNFFIKPQQKADLRAQLYTTQDISICLDFFEITAQNKYLKIKDSGTYSPYRMGVFITLKPSRDNKGYLLVCSTYETSERGSFTVNIESVPEGALFIVQDFTNRLAFDNSSLLDSQT